MATTKEVVAAQLGIKKDAVPMLKCKECVIEMAVSTFVYDIQNGWDGHHNFQNRVWNKNNVITCTGQFVTKEN